MAQSRLEKVGTIYSRVTALLKTGAMKEENKPFWLDIYKAFPPKHEPRFDRPSSNAPIRQIFYSEDKIRAKFHNDFKTHSQINMLDSSRTSRTELFLEIYRRKERGGLSESEAYEKAVKEFLENVESDSVVENSREFPAEMVKKGSNKKEDTFVDLESMFTASDWKTDAQSEGESSKVPEEFRPVRLRLDNLGNDEKNKS
ncbi:hypothetical protein QAD02_014353 [Eretmocerus hayati]|uniref:Uncharacterized protein n=1 Tax=Eretmocerus hayati TaxID=131215 RepID=A0ACC2P6R8_9HYME|nr:hypothetical protein QAD02_014353 [Eretmocerus hayati]